MMQGKPDATAAIREAMQIRNLIQGALAKIKMALPLGQYAVQFGCKYRTAFRGAEACNIQYFQGFRQCPRLVVLFDAACSILPITQAKTVMMQDQLFESCTQLGYIQRGGSNQKVLIPMMSLGEGMMEKPLLDREQGGFAFQYALFSLQCRLIRSLPNLR